MPAPVTYFFAFRWMYENEIVLDEVILTVEPHLTVFKGLDQLQDEALRHHGSYPDSRTAFHAAVTALREILASL